MTSRLRARLRRVPRNVWSLAAVVVLYLLVEQLLSYETRVVGLLSPGGSPHWGVLLLGAVYVALRLAVRFVVPAVAVALVVQFLVAAVSQRASPSKSQGS